MRKDKIEKEDTKVLREIVAVLGNVGGQLDAADKVRDYDPWSVIASQEAEVKSLAEMLSDRFCRTHSDLVKRLMACTNLHLGWGNLQDEIMAVIRQEV